MGLTYLMVIIVFYNAVSRYLFKLSYISLQELEWHFFSAAFLLAISFTLKHKQHVRLDIIYQYYPKKFKQVFWIFINIVFIIPFSIMIVIYGWDFGHMSFVQNEVSDSGGLPYRFIIKSMPSVAFLFVIVQSLSEIIKTSVDLKAKK